MRGATGNLGSKTVKHLLTKEIQIHALVRNQTDKNKKDNLVNAGVTIHELDMRNLAAVTNACVGADCVLSMLSGLQDVIIDAQKVLLDGAVAAGVPRFILSDFSIDFRNLVFGKTGTWI